jgi:hypothetical protein
LIRQIILGLWVCIASLGAVFGVTRWQEGKGANADQAAAPKLATLRTRNISVPILDNGRVLGYVVARFEFSADADAAKTTGMPPESLISDEAFKRIYSRDGEAAQKMRKHDLEALTKEISDGVNKRVGQVLIKDVLIETWSYLNKEDLDKLNEQFKH